MYSIFVWRHKCTGNVCIVNTFVILSVQMVLRCITGLWHFCSEVRGNPQRAKEWLLLPTALVSVQREDDVFSGGREELGLNEAKREFTKIPNDAVLDTIKEKKGKCSHLFFLTVRWDNRCHSAHGLRKREENIQHSFKKYLWIYLIYSKAHKSLFKQHVAVTRFRCDVSIR